MNICKAYSVLNRPNIAANAYCVQRIYEVLQ